MCEANAYLSKGQEQEIIMESVTRVRQEGSEVVVNDLFGSEKRVGGRISEIDMTKNSIIISAA